jgi:hypothetical protein
VGGLDHAGGLVQEVLGSGLAQHPLGTLRRGDSERQPAVLVVVVPVAHEVPLAGEPVRGAVAKALAGVGEGEAERPDPVEGAIRHPG